MKGFDIIWEGAYQWQHLPCGWKGQANTYESRNLSNAACLIEIFDHIMTCPKLAEIQAAAKINPLHTFGD